MVFIQCKDTADVESQLDKLKFGFVTQDHRIYQTLTLGNDAEYFDIDAQTILALMDLQHELEYLTDGFLETDFRELLHHAKRFEETFKKTLLAIKFKPLKKRGNNK